MSRPRRPFNIRDASLKLGYARDLAGLAASRGDDSAHRALNATLQAAAAAFGRQPDAFMEAVDRARDAAAPLPMLAEVRAEALDDATLAELRSFVVELFGHVTAVARDDDATPAESASAMQDAVAFDLLILSQSLSRGQRTVYGWDGEPGDVLVRLAACREQTLREQALLPPGHPDIRP
jgi:uncharacterized protein GlcG (DUF336 family)